MIPAADAETGLVSGEPKRAHWCRGPMPVAFVVLAGVLLVVSGFLIAIVTSASNDDAHTPTPVTGVCPVAVVGSGPGGLHVALGLLKAGVPSSDICVFEATDQVGGRLRSLFMDGMPATPLELGGMQIENSHHMVKAAVAHYNMSYEKRQFPAANFDYLRNTHTQSARWSHERPAEIPYRLTTKDLEYLGRGLGDGPSDFVYAVFDAVGLTPYDVRGWDSCKWADFKENSRFSNTTMRNSDVGWWWALQQLLSDEAIQAYRDALGYDSFVEETNLATVLSYVLPVYNTTGDEGDMYRFTTTGYQALARHMAADYAARGGADIHFNAELRRVDEAEKGLRLTFRDGTVYSADRVVYAMSAPAIAALEDPGPSFPYGSEARQLLSAVRPVGAFKMFLLFDEAWWERLGFSTGQMASTLPFRKAYYWGLEATHGDPANKNAALLAGYDDDAASHYWQGMLRNEEVLAPVYFAHNPHFEQAHELVDLYSGDTRAVAVRAMMKQLRTAHAGVRVPDPFGAVFMDWTRAPHGAAWHAWKVGQAGPAASRALRNPAVGNTYVCGEAFSDEQGWVEGALRSCERLLIEQFGVTSPWDAYTRCA